MAQVLDTNQIRKAARLIRQLSTTLDTDVDEAIQRAGTLAEDLQGQTADAMIDQFRLSHRKIQSICDELEFIRRNLSAYADAIEETDARLASIMRGGR